MDEQVMSAEGERMQKVLRQLEGFVPAPESPAAKLPRLSGVFKAVPSPEPDAVESAACEIGSE